MTSDQRSAQLRPVVLAAQRVAGLVAARARADAEGTRTLMLSFDDAQELAGGALLVAELSMGLLSRATGESLDECVASLCLELEQALGVP
ncbi:hypothetical protein [Nocardioides daejeonensis]|uniref:hypothetical protein n=1 Tax=Nocardioides daejeonensis TaxID=1046556 RepID=UPI000D74521F|nr:hypothetical protein [Nocardioides daejeonensis]